LTTGFSLPAHANSGATSVTNGITTVDLTNPAVLTPTALANMLVGVNSTGISSVTNAKFTGNPVQLGTVHVVDPAVVSFNDGVILSSGNIADVVGPNKSDSTTGDEGNPGDPDLDNLIANTQTVFPSTYDAASLEFDFTPSASKVYFTYVFGSDEYLEWVNLYNDVFALFVNGHAPANNCAVTPNNAPVSIDTINSNVNTPLFRDNAFGTSTNPLNIESDGLTVEMVCAADVIPNQPNHMKFAIADTSDHVLDSIVMIKSGSLSTAKPELCFNGVDDDGNGDTDLNDVKCKNTITLAPVGQSGVTTPVTVPVAPPSTPSAPVPTLITTPPFTGNEGSPILLDANFKGWKDNAFTNYVSWKVYKKGDPTNSAGCVVPLPYLVPHKPGTPIELSSVICPQDGEYTARADGWDTPSDSVWDYDVDFFVHNAPPALQLDTANSTPSQTMPNGLNEISVIPGDAVTLAIYVQDPGGDASTCKIDWADGNVSSGLTPDSNGNCTASHTYASAGSYVTSVKGTDSQGASSAYLVPVNVVSLPNAPTLETVTATDSQVTVDWAAPKNTGGAPIDSYSVLMSTTIDGIFDNASIDCSDIMATSCVVSGLTNGQSYYFQVIAHNYMGWSAPSVTSSEMIPLVAQDPIFIDNTTLTGTAGTPISLTTTGGTGSGALTFAATGTGCTISGATINANGVVTCSVIATKASDGTYALATSDPVTFTFGLAQQATLAISNATLTGTAGTAVTLTASGGSGSGLLSFAATGSSCSVSGTSLITTAATTCTVTATKDASGIYDVATSGSKNFIFALATQATLVISNSPLTGTVGTPITLTTTGGSGTGNVSFTTTGNGCSVSGTSLTATAATTCIVTASKAASGVYALANSAPKSFGFGLAQATLTISNTTVTATAGATITLTSTGGSGTGAVSYSVTGTGCAVTGTALTTTVAGTCVVTATKAASGNYSAAISAPKTFTFNPANQTTLTISNTTLTGFAGTAITLTTSGGSGTGVVTFTATGTTCSVTGSSLNSTGAGTCVVTASKAASGIYGVATSATKSFVFSLAPQATLTISNTTLTGTAGTAIALLTSGGSGSGAVSFATTGTGCSISNAIVNATGAATCVVTATKAASGIYASATSASKSFVFTLAPQAPLSITNSPLTGTAGTAIPLTSTGGSGTGAVTYAATGTGCSISSGSLNATGASTCTVTATKAASGIYSATISPSVKFVFSLATQTALVISTSNTSTIAKGTTGITLATTGGSGTGAVTYVATGTGCVISSAKLTVATSVSPGLNVFCSVVATKAAQGIYAATSSVAKVFTFK
jgi:hypothetical protein